MRAFVIVVALLIAAIGLVGVVAPARLAGFVRIWQNAVGLYSAAVLRIVLGVAMFFTAPTSRAPEPLRALGVFVFLAGLVTPLIGLDRFRRILDWWIARPPFLMRGWSLVALAFGLFVVYALFP